MFEVYYIVFLVSGLDDDDDDDDDDEDDDDDDDDDDHDDDDDDDVQDTICFFLSHGHQYVHYLISDISIVELLQVQNTFCVFADPTTDILRGCSSCKSTETCRRVAEASLILVEWWFVQMPRMEKHGGKPQNPQNGGWLWYVAASSFFKSSARNLFKYFTWNWRITVSFERTTLNYDGASTWDSGAHLLLFHDWIH